MAAGAVAVHLRDEVMLPPGLEPRLTECEIGTTSIVGTSFTVDAISAVATVILGRRIVRKFSCGNPSSTCFLLADSMTVTAGGVDIMLSAGGVQTVTSSGLCGMASVLFISAIKLSQMNYDLRR